MRPILYLIVLFAACGRQAEALPPDRSAPHDSGIPAPPAQPVSVEETTDLYEFDFAWSAEAAAVPELAQRLRAELAKAKTELIANAREQKARREKQGYAFPPFMSSTVYETAGQTPRLLSLRVDAGGYEGGAHGNFGIGALLWDREAKREIAFTELFAEPAGRDRVLRHGWCEALSQARAEKRGEPASSGGLFDDCPALDDIAIIPTDSDNDGRFDRLLLAASPYVAGPWVEGAYEVRLAVPPAFLVELKPDYRSSFVR